MSMIFNELISVRAETINDHASVYAVNKADFGQEAESMLVDQLRQSESFMAFELKPGALENVSGMVQYPKEFNDL